MSQAEKEAHYGAVRRVLIYVLGANLLVTVVKITIGITTGALSVIADGFHSLVDSSSNLIGLAAIRLAERPADERHPYGYSRYETLGALAIGGMLLLAAYEIVSEVLNRFISGEVIEVSPLAFWIMLATFPVNVAVVILEKRAGRQLGSEVLIADAKHTQADLYVTASVLVSLLAAQFGLYWLDGAAALFVVVMIVRAAFDILGDTTRWLTDTAIFDAEDIEEVALGVPGVRFVHRIRSRGNPEAVFIDLHAKVNPGMSTSQSHALASEIERRLAENFENLAEAIVHIEPARYERPSRWEQMRLDLRSIADGMGLGLHDLYVHADSEGKYTVELHLELEGEMRLKEAHKLADEFEALVKQRWPQAEEVVTHLEPVPQDLLLAGEEMGEALAESVRALMEKHLAPEQIADIRLFRSGGHQHAALTVHLRGEMRLAETHEIAERIEMEILKHEPGLARVTLHVEPAED